ncbi:uncharacterized protein LOC126282393 [Schistocerca gregaria]|uniref:uncharacterized protein LOC126282393 n=1 Tax=Schistocerca gregaria TaxID=7010 RepID=UPI00211DF942|nr:uncharacterized protein LOC126282393 [Schistocerca gregaria]
MQHMLLAVLRPSLLRVRDRLRAAPAAAAAAATASTSRSTGRGNNQQQERRQQPGPRLTPLAGAASPVTTPASAASPGVALLPRLHSAPSGSRCKRSRSPPRSAARAARVRARPLLTECVGIAMAPARSKPDSSRAPSSAARSAMLQDPRPAPVVGPLFSAPSTALWEHRLVLFLTLNYSYLN